MDTVAELVRLFAIQIIWTPVHTITVGISAKLLSQFTWLSPPLSIPPSHYSPCPLLLFLFWKVNANARVLYWQSLPLVLPWMAVHYLHQHHNPSKRVVGQGNGTMYFEFKLGRHICISTHPLLLFFPVLATIPFANLFCIVGICRFSERNKCAGDSHSNWVETVLLRALCWGWCRCCGGVIRLLFVLCVWVEFLLNNNTTSSGFPFLAESDQE